MSVKRSEEEILTRIFFVHFHFFSSSLSIHIHNINIGKHAHGIVKPRKKGKVVVVVVVIVIVIVVVLKSLKEKRSKKNIETVNRKVTYVTKKKQEAHKIVTLKSSDVRLDPPPFNVLFTNNFFPFQSI